MNIFFKKLMQIKPTLYEYGAAGTYSLDLPAGRYEISMVGAGGASNYKRELATSNPVITWRGTSAEGGVGGTAVAVINLYVSSTITIVVGSSAGVRNSSIVGIAGATLVAGGGTPANVPSVSSGTPGVMGANTISGSSIVSVLHNNDINVISDSVYYDRIANFPINRVQQNLNWSENTGVGASNAAGFVRIKKVI